MQPPLRIITSNRRTLALEINERAELIVRSPRGMSESTITQFIESKTAWIQKQLNRLFILQKDRPERTYTDGSYILFLGEEYPLRIVADQQRAVYFDKGFFIPEVQAGKARDTLRTWFKKEALRYIKPRVTRMARYHDVAVKTVRITDALTRWGSCGHRGTLNFSWRVIMAPSAIIEYVIAHEIAHLTVKNHGRSFWQRVEEICPNYQEAHAWLKDHGARLML